MSVSPPFLVTAPPSWEDELTLEPLYSIGSTAHCWDVAAVMLIWQPDRYASNLREHSRRTVVFHRPCSIGENRGLRRNSRGPPCLSAGGGGSSGAPAPFLKCDARSVFDSSLLMKKSGGVQLCPPALCESCVTFTLRREKFTAYSVPGRSTCLSSLSPAAAVIFVMTLIFGSRLSFEARLAEEGPEICPPRLRDCTHRFLARPPPSIWRNRLRQLDISLFVSDYGSGAKPRNAYVVESSKWSFPDRQSEYPEMFVRACASPVCWLAKAPSGKSGAHFRHGRGERQMINLWRDMTSPLCSHGAG